MSCQSYTAQDLSFFPVYSYLSAFSRSYFAIAWGQFFVISLDMLVDQDWQNIAYFLVRYFK